MRLVAILEVPTGSEQHPPSELLRAAYLASRRGPVALLLPQGADQAIDRELDPLVAADRFVHGVRYSRVSDTSVWNSASRSTVVVGDSTDVQRRAATIGAGCVDFSAGLDALTRLCADAPSV